MWLRWRFKLSWQQWATIQGLQKFQWNCFSLWIRSKIYSRIFATFWWSLLKINKNIFVYSWKTRPIKSKQIKGSQAPFIKMSLSKIIMQKSKVQSKYLEWPFCENFLNYKKVKSKYNSLGRKPRKEYFQNVRNANSYSKSFRMLSNLLKI